MRRLHGSTRLRNCRPRPRTQILMSSPRDRLEHYRGYFEALLAEETELRLLYEPLDAVLKLFGSTIAKLRFNVRRVVDVEQWSSRGEGLLDLRRDGPFRGSGELTRRAEELLLPHWEAGNATQAADAIDHFAKTFSDGLRAQRLSSATSGLNEAEWDRAVFPMDL